ncbi:MAG: beta strand repeat-containing protein [Cytophagales bacterium]
MRKIFMGIAFLFINTHTNADTITWTNSGGDNVWSNVDNWDSGTVPTSSDDVIFDNDQNCEIDESVSIKSLTIESSYTGNISRSAGIVSMTILNKLGSVSFDISAVSDAVTISSNTNIQDGYVNLGVGTIALTNVTISGGVLELPGSSNTFNGNVIVNNGTLLLSNASGTSNFNGSLFRVGSGIINSSLSGGFFRTDNSTISGGLIFREVRFFAPTPALPTIRNYFIDGKLEVLSSLTFSPSTRSIILNRDPVYLSGNYVASTSIINNGTVTSNNLFVFTGNAAQTVNISNTASRFFRVGELQFNNTGLGVTLTSSISGSNLLGGVTILGGTLNAGINTISLPTNQNFQMNNGSTFVTSTAFLPSFSGSGTFISPSTYTISLTGSLSQSISSPYGDLNTLSINKPTSGDVTLSSPTSITGFLTLNLNASNKLNTNGNLTLVSTATQTASLIDNNNTGNAVNGNVTVQRFYAGAGRPKFFGSPIASGASVSTLGEGTWKALLYTETGQEAGIPRLAASFSGSFRNANLLNSGMLEVGRGYSIRKDADGTVNFTGAVNNGTINIGVTSTSGSFGIVPGGFNLLSNPYPSALDWTLVNPNSTGVPTIGVQIWNGSTYIPTSNIGSGQGFFVRATSSGNITLTNAARITNGTANNTFLRTEQASKWLYLYAKSVTGGFNDALAFTFNENATNNYDVNFDLTKIFIAAAPSSPLLFTRPDGNRLSLDVRPFPTTDLVIPITIVVNASGNYSFSTSSINDWYSDYSVFLKDSTSDGIKYTNLKTVEKYDFIKKTTDTDGATRFAIIFKYTPMANNGTTTGVIDTPGGNNDGNGGFGGIGIALIDTLTFEQGVPDSELRVAVVDTVEVITETTSLEIQGTKIYTKGTTVCIDFGVNLANSDLIICDLLGKIVFEARGLESKGIQSIQLNQATNAVFLVKLINNKEFLTKKIILH